MKFPSALLVAIFHITSISSSKDSLRVHENRNEVAEMLYHVILKNFAGKYSSLYILKPANRSDIHIDDFAEAITAKWLNADIAISFRIETVSLDSSTKRPRQSAIILIEDLDDFRNTLKLVDLGLLWVHGKFVVVPVRGDFEGSEQIFSIAWQHQLYNVNLLLEQSNGTIHVKTFLPFLENSCYNTKPFLLNEFSHGRFVDEKKNFFPEKIDNFHGCRVRIATSNNAEPYIFAHKQPNGSYELSGRDINMLKVLAQGLNFEIEYVFIGDEGYLLDNGTAVGPFLMLLNREADLVAADYWLKVNRAKFVDFTTAYNTQHIAFIIPPGAAYTTLEKFFRPLDIYSWIGFFTIVVLGFVVIFVLERRTQRDLSEFIFGAGVDEPYLNILIAIVGGSQTQLPYGNFARFILMMFLIFCLVIRSVYTGALYDYLQKDAFHKEAQSIDDMIHRDYGFYAVPNILDLIEGQTRIYERVVVFKSSDRTKILNELTTNSNFKGALFRSYFGALYSNQLNFKYHNGTHLLLCKELFLMIPVVFYLQKHSFLLNVVNEQIELVKASGLSDYWHQSIIDERYLIVVESKEPKAIKIEYLQGTFNVLLAGQGVAVIAFLWELTKSHFMHFRERRRKLQAVKK